VSGRFGKPDETGRSSGKFAGQRGKQLGPPKDQPWIWLTRELLESDAWQSLSINARRLIDFLLLEHMAHAGRENGNLKATYGQLEKFGLTPNRIAAAIAEAENAGLVDCHRGGMRVATTYRLTFYPLPDGTAPTHRWKQYRAPVQKQKSAPKSEGSKPPEMLVNSQICPQR